MTRLPRLCLSFHPTPQIWCREIFEVPKNREPLLVPVELERQEETPSQFAAWETLSKPDADGVWLSEMAPGSKE